MVVSQPTSLTTYMEKALLTITRRTPRITYRDESNVRIRNKMCRMYTISHKKAVYSLEERRVFGGWRVACWPAASCWGEWTRWAWRPAIACCPAAAQAWCLASSASVCSVAERNWYREGLFECQGVMHFMAETRTSSISWSSIVKFEHYDMVVCSKVDVKNKADCCNMNFRNTLSIYKDC